MLQRQRATCSVAAWPIQTLPIVGVKVQQLPIFWVRNAEARHAERVADSLEQFLERVLDSKGRPYFREPGFTPGERVDLS
jgi:hypothetical protein